MKLTMNVVDNDVTSPEIVGGKNFIGVGSYFGTTANTIFRNEGRRVLTAWDFTTDLIPKQEFNIASEQVKILEWGNYGYGTYTPNGSTTVIYDGLNNNYVAVGQEMDINELGFNLESGRYYIDYTDMYIDTIVDHYWYMKFFLSSDVDKIHTIHFYKGSKKVAYPSIDNIKTYQVSPNTVVPILMAEMFDNFEYYDPDMISIAETETALLNEAIASSLEQYYGGIAPDKFLKINLLNGNSDSAYSAYESIPRLTYMGQPVYYGQSLSYKDIQNGGLLLNTEGLNVGDYYELNIAIEGTVNIKLHIQIS